jgi:hypothetical protein
MEGRKLAKLTGELGLSGKEPQITQMNADFEIGVHLRNLRL